MRKTVGARKRQLVEQFLGESLLMTLIAMVFALIIVELTLPAFNELSGKSISTEYTNIVFIAGLIGTLLFTGIIAGSYPALYLSAFNPVRILMNGSKNNKGSSTFRKILVVFQFSLSVALIFITIIIYQQIEFSKNMKLGYNKENLMYVPIIENLQSKYEVMKNELIKSKLIYDVSAHNYNFVSAPTPRAAGFIWEGMEENRENDLDLIFSGVDYSFFEMLDIAPVEGRFFSKEYSTDNNGAVLNEAAIADMGLEESIGKRISLGDWEKTIIGVVKDVHFRSTRRAVEPRIYYLDDYSSNADGIILIKIDGTKTPEAISFIKDEWEKINSVSPFEYGFIDKEYESLYKSESRIGTIFNWFTLIAIIISILGLFGLASFLIEIRTKEIGVRKVLGASVPRIAILVSKDFIKWVLLANIIAWPIAYYFMNNWLQDFVYRVNLTIWPFIASGLIALILAVATVSYQSIKTATANPVDSLKYE
jgi:ABC-type antimicrobial peptide transport system permease subunit